MSILGGRGWVALATLCVVALFPACGARTKLRGAQPCRVAGEISECRGVCGQGTTECVDGFWTECAIPRAVEACDNDCGTGTRTCDDELWSECFVERVEESCDNDCGTGTRSCEDNEWSECFVEPVTQECTFGCGPGFQTCTDNEWGECDATRPLPPVLTATVRDFQASHPDFEITLDRAGFEEGIVADFLGPDGKPVYAHGPEGTTSTSGPDNFNQWYNDVPGVNQSTEITITLEPRDTTNEFYVYENRFFFPIDDQLFGNTPGYIHNYHFTLEAEATFVYREGQVFAFDGDDDIWVFINNRLVIDLGGTHESLRRDVSLDAVAAEIGIVPGNEYPLKIFFAERHTVDSNFVIETSIANLGECP